jgi:hypothetical protein
MDVKWTCDIFITQGSGHVGQRIDGQLNIILLQGTGKSGDNGLKVCADRTRSLICPLGKWIGNREEWIAQWDCLVTENMEMLYVRTENSIGWTRHIAHRARRHRYQRFYLESIRCNGPLEAPENLYRGTVHYFRNYIELIAIERPPQNWRDTRQLDFSLWDEFPVDRAHLLERLKEALPLVYLDATADLDLLFQDFSQGTMVAVSDGSYFPETQNAACAWLMESSCQTQWIMGSIITSYSIRYIAYIGVKWRDY